MPAPCPGGGGGSVLPRSLILDANGQASSGRGEIEIAKKDNWASRILSSITGGEPARQFRPKSRGAN
ncbi:hypothetical protein MYCTH_2297010 [Thermothelomyces thermophilus ATCC 42464]|uniref:Uncharacterized protein n=1 Tax=Thermothelomyces thermophilus (strain ATCC 42464 / BCRC 31852 / DSM 1799) TaxID=573729 RepID=G2Q3T1_THET4|nr:uncharacterized protein MYCTH_2297010 [Thermothelomyces thermophilus ATCC 42464]AEO54434.1 hypothetical protein MYCTH_2297010 [Thermothelomyces thermophilus ATCC 42464]